MTVQEYMEKLDEKIRSLLELCEIAESTTTLVYPCRGCALEKHEGKPCPICQLIDIRDALRYAVEHGVNNIRTDTSMDTAQVIVFLRRAVANGHSIRTLRFCSQEYIKERNLVEIDSEEVTAE